MAIAHIDVQHLRNISRTELNFCLGLNVIIGPNASGKTSLLEAISLVCQGRSFRTTRINQLLQHDENEMIVLAKLNINKQPQLIGLSRSEKKTLVKINGEIVKTTTELASRIPFFVLRPESHELLDSGPKMRRQYLDWGVFHVKPQYLEVWKKYHRILRQRNMGLRRQLPHQEIQLWDKPLVEVGQQLHQLRADYIDSLSPFLSEFGEELIGEKPTFDYYPGWKAGKNEPVFEEQLQLAIDKDLERGYTRLGPHRADIKMTIRGKPVQNVFSRGQQKLLICAMTLAQIKQHPQDSILLVDDLPAELDPQKRQILMGILKNAHIQVFVTATETNLIETSSWTEKKLFHVKHGSFQEVV